MAVRGYDDRQGTHQVRRDPQERASLLARLANTIGIAVLDVSDTAVDDLERIGARGTAKVMTLDYRRRESPLRGVPSGAGAENATADHDYIELLVR
jgi:hypothetical protein